MFSSVVVLGNRAGMMIGSSLVRALWDKAAVCVTIRIEPMGRTAVSFDRETRSAELLMRLFSQYAAKMRCLLTTRSNSNAEILSWYELLLSEVIECWPKAPADGLLGRLQIIEGIATEKEAAQVPWAALGGERFRVVLVESKGRPGKYVMQNDFTIPGLLFNWALNVFVLLEAIVPRLNVHDLKVFREVLVGLQNVMFGLGCDRARTLRGGGRMIDEADEVVDEIVSRLGVGEGGVTSSNINYPRASGTP